MTQFWQRCIDGLINGSLFALVALGYTMVYGIIGLINFAHGDVFMLGALLAWTLIRAIDLGVDSSGGETLAVLVLLLVVVPAFLRRDQSGDRPARL